MDKNTENYCGPEVIPAAQNGDQEAFNILYQYSYDAVRRTVSSIISKDEDIEDVIQETYIKAYRKLDTLNNQETFKWWICQIAKNTALDYLKKNRPLSFSDIAFDEEDNPGERIIETNPDHLPEESLEKEENKKILYDKLLGSLTERQRKVVHCIFIEGRTEKETAEILGISVNTVKSHVFHARRKLEKKIDELKRQGVKLHSSQIAPLLIYLTKVEKESKDVIIVRNVTANPDKRDIKLLSKHSRRYLSLNKTATTAVKRSGRVLAAKAVMGISIVSLTAGSFALGYSKLKKDRNTPVNIESSEINTTENPGPKNTEEKQINTRLRNIIPQEAVFSKGAALKDTYLYPGPTEKVYEIGEVYKGRTFDVIKKVESRDDQNEKEEWYLIQYNVEEESYLGYLKAEDVADANTVEAEPGEPYLMKKSDYYEDGSEEEYLGPLYLDGRDENTGKYKLISQDNGTAEVYYIEDLSILIPYSGLGPGRIGGM